MHDLNHQLKELCQRNRDGSFATQADRERLLTLCANDLAARGFQHLNAASLKPKHVAALLDKWKQDGISTGTLKNRMSALRWWAEKVGKKSVIACSNAEYGIDKRVFVTNVSKAKVLDADMLARVTDPYTRMSLQLQAAFGLRWEESIKIKPGWADCGSFLRLQDSWAKGGRYREVPITTAQQRAVLDAAKALAGKGSLIPAQLRYKDQLNRFRAQCDKAGIHGVHGLRHAYAQRRYAELTGRLCPAHGGSTSKQLTAADKLADQKARLKLSDELGILANRSPRFTLAGNSFKHHFFPIFINHRSNHVYDQKIPPFVSSDRGDRIVSHNNLAESEGRLVPCTDSHRPQVSCLGCR